MRLPGHLSREVGGGGASEALEALRTLPHWLQPSDSAAWAPFCASGKGISAVHEKEEGGRIRLGSRLGETASPSVLIKFPQPPRLSGASRQTALQAGGEKRAPGSLQPPPALERELLDQEGLQLPASSLAGLQPPLPEGSAPARGAWGQDVGLFLTRHFLIHLEDWKPGFQLPQTPLLAAPGPSVHLETFYFGRSYFYARATAGPPSSGSKTYLETKEPALKKGPVLCIETHYLRVEGIFQSQSICRLPPPPPTPLAKSPPPSCLFLPTYFQELLFWTQERSSFYFSSIPSES